MKKILIAIDSFGGGGAEKVLSTILNSNKIVNYSVTLFAFNNSGIYQNMFFKKFKIKYVFRHLDNYYAFLPKHVFKLLVSIRFLIISVITRYPYFFYKINFREIFDIEISFLEGGTARLISNSPNRKSKKLAWIHTDLSYLSVIQKKKFNKIYLKFDKIAFVSNSVRDKFCSIYPFFDREKCEVIYNPIDIEDIKHKSNEFRLDKKNLTILSVGRMTFEKGQDRLVRAFSNVVHIDSSLRLMLVGNGLCEEKLHLLVSNLGIENRVDFMGFQDNPFPYVLLSDIYVLPSRREGFPLCLCEAIALGKPIISTRCPGSEEILGNSEFGIVLKNCSNDEMVIKQLSDELIKMITSTELRKSYSDQALKRQSFFDIGKTMEQIFVFIDSQNQV